MLVTDLSDKNFVEETVVAILHADIFKCHQRAPTFKNVTKASILSPTSINLTLNDLILGENGETLLVGNTSWGSGTCSDGYPAAWSNNRNPEVQNWIKYNANLDY